MLSADEIDDTEIYLIKKMKKEQFPEDYKNLFTEKEVPLNSKIVALHPSIDENRLICSSG